MAESLSIGGVEENHNGVNGASRARICVQRAPGRINELRQCTNNFVIRFPMIGQH